MIILHMIIQIYHAEKIHQKHLIEKVVCVILDILGKIKMMLITWIVYQKLYIILVLQQKIYIYEVIIIVIVLVDMYGPVIKMNVLKVMKVFQKLKQTMIH